MADELTPNFGLTKPDVGKSDDTWGQKINTNFDLIDVALAGGGGSEGGGSGIPSDNTPAMDGVGDAGTFVSYSRGDHSHPSDTSKVNKEGDAMDGPLDVVHPPVNNTHAASKQYVDEAISGGGVLPSDFMPLMSGVAAPGVDAKYSRGDHVHPSDTAKINKLGDSMIGPLDVVHPPSAITHAVGKQYVDNAITGIVTTVGDVDGPAAAGDNNFAIYSGVTGKILKDLGLSLDTAGTLAANSDVKIPSQKAVKTYVDGRPAPPVTSVFTRIGAIVAAAGDYIATQITYTPPGGMVANNAQAAITELHTNKMAASKLPSSGVTAGAVPRFKNAAGDQEATTLLVDANNFLTLPNGMRTTQVTLNDDTAVGIGLPNGGAAAMVAFACGQAPGPIGPSIIAAGNFATASIAPGIVGTNDVTNVNTKNSGLFGTTGIDGKVTIGNNGSGVIFIENRLGATRSWNVTILAG